MSRSISAKAWDGKQWRSDIVLWCGEWHRIFEDTPDNNDIMVDAMNVVDWPVVISTGLKDKEGREIYEGDIVRTDLFEGLHNDLTGEIVYVDKWGCFCMKPFGKHCILDSVHGWLYSPDGENMATIIGNIYEHKHLLEEHKKKEDGV